MPFKSEAQRRWAHTTTGTKALGGIDKVKEWDAASKGMKLDEHVKKTQKKPDSKKESLIGMGSVGDGS